MSPEQPYVNLYQATRDSLMAASPKVMNTLRDEAIDVFAPVKTEFPWDK